MKPKLINFITLITVFLIITGCGDSSSQQTSAQIDPTGDWAVTMTNLIDGCELFPDGFTQFEDLHTVISSEDAISLTSEALPLQEYQGSFRSEDSFTVQSEITDDLFATGFNCTLSEKIAYNDLVSENNETSALILYEVKIVCDNGTRCDTGARGVAVKNGAAKNILTTS